MGTFRNKINIIGRIGMNPNVQESTTGTKFCRFSVAVQERMKDTKGNWIDNTQWMNLIAFGFTAERLGKYAIKGMEINVEGKLKNRQYEEKDGSKRYVTDIQVDDFQLLNIKHSSNSIATKTTARKK